MDTNKIDANMRNLVRIMNKIPGVKTIGSCGGHSDPQPGQWDAGKWYLKFSLDLAERDTLDWLAWAINNDLRSAYPVFLMPIMPPPNLNPDIHANWVIECYGGATPDMVANFLKKHVLPEVVDDYTNCQEHGDQWEPNCPRCEKCSKHHYGKTVAEMLRQWEQDPPITLIPLDTEQGLQDAFNLLKRRRQGKNN